uniref:Uncharacterized protein n=1 Tax=Anguilla anguilla TaxID=7936 RepID=A0A0E9V667_ANGAN
MHRKHGRLGVNIMG